VWTSGTQLRYLTPLLTGASLQQSAPNVQQLLYENLLSYDGGFGAGLHRVSAVAGQTSQRNDYTTISGFRTNFTNEQLQQLNAGGASAAGLPGGFTVPFRTNSVLARATYAFRDRYLVTGSARRDCSTRFSAGNRCGTFGAGSLGWVVSEEPFFKPIPGVRLQLLQGAGEHRRARRPEHRRPGLRGADRPEPELRGAGPRRRDAGLGRRHADPRGQHQPALAAEPQHQRRLRPGVMDNALTFTADYYVSKADQVLVSLPVPNSLGSVGDPVFNAGSVRNAGFELGATHRMERGALKLNNTLTLTTTSNRVTSLGGANGAPIRRGPEEVARTDVGQPIGSFFVIRTAGLFQSDADVQAHKNSKGVVIQPNAKAGDLRFVDANGDGTINNDDRQFTGSPIPKLTSGLFMNASYGSFGAGLNLRGAFGNKIYNAVRLQTDRVTGVSNVRADYNPWTPTNTNTSTPRAVFGDAVNGNPATDRWLEDGDFVRIQNVELSYTLPQRLYQRARLGLANAPRVFVNAQNLYTFTRYSGYDPEVLGFGDPLARGIDDGFIYPNPRQFTLGFDVRF
jgi:hypothetical protein